MVRIKTRVRYEDFNISYFTAEFICAGARDSIIGMYRFLSEKGAQLKNEKEDKLLLSSKTDIVLFCTIEGINNSFACVQLKKKEWWNFYHNKRIKKNRPTYYTYNLPSQWTEMLQEGCIWKEKETLIST